MLALPIFPGSHPPSIVGACELNFCVRDGNRWTLTAINTNSSGWLLHHLYRQKHFLLLTSQIIPYPAEPVNYLLNALPLVFPELGTPLNRRFNGEAASNDIVGALRLRKAQLNVICEELVTRTGFEPMLKA